VAAIGIRAQHYHEFVILEHDYVFLLLLTGCWSRVLVSSTFFKQVAQEAMGAGFSTYGVKNTKVYMRCPELDAPDMHVRSNSSVHQRISLKLNRAHRYFTNSSPSCNFKFAVRILPVVHSTLLLIREQSAGRVMRWIASALQHDLECFHPT
jgi:hypothetical protein